MLLNQLFEDAEADLRRSQMAYRFVQNLTSYLSRLNKEGRKINSLPMYVVSHDAPEGYHGVVSDDFGYSGGMLRGVLVCFRPSDYPEVHGSAAPVADGGGDIRFVVQMDIRTGNLSDLMHGVSGDTGQTTLLHELIHVIDYIRYKRKEGILSRPIVRVKKNAPKPEDMTDEERYAHATKVAKVYHNDPLERNAFFNNIAEPILKRMRFLQNDSMAHEFFDPISHNFADYFKKELKGSRHAAILQHWKMIDEAGKRRIISRLKQLFDLYWKMLDAKEAEKAKYAQENPIEVQA